MCIFIRCSFNNLLSSTQTGHPQQEHETHHGSMSKTRWAVDGPDGTILELNGRKFSTDDEGAPMMCNLFCQDMGRHVHLDYCRTDPGDRCEGAELQHITARLTPHADRPKDWISHSLYWRRSGTFVLSILLLLLTAVTQGSKVNIAAISLMICS
jgi:hypothetical protein